jgi:EamA-like transporter family.
MLALAGVFFFKEKLNLKQMAGFGIAGIGLFLFYRTQLQTFIHDTNAFNLGFFWVELGAVTWVLYAVLQKKLVQQHPAQVLNMVLYGIPALIYTPMADFSAFQGLDFKTWAIVVFLGVNTLVAYGSIALAFKYTEAYKVSIIVTLNPIITLITMSVLTYLQVSWIQPESMTLYSIIGAILVLGGAVTAVFFSREKKKRVLAEVSK